MTLALSSAPAAYRARPTCAVQERGRWHDVTCRALAAVEVTATVETSLELGGLIHITYGICPEHVRRLSAGENLEIA